MTTIWWSLSSNRGARSGLIGRTLCSRIRVSRFRPHNSLRKLSGSADVTHGVNYCAGQSRHITVRRYSHMAKTMTPIEWRQVLVKMEPNGKPWILDGLADAMPIIVERYKINTTTRQTHFLATLAHESDHFRTTREYASGAAYEGRKDLGNTQPGDGKRFRGRGLIQLTGRANYAAASAAMGEDYIGNPDLVERFPAAAMVSGWFWQKNDINKHADKDDVRAVCKVVNGGYNGLDSRIALTKIAGTALV